MRQRNYAIDIAKILGCILVVMNHTTLALTQFKGQFSWSWVLAVAVFFIVKIGVPMFILATGALVLTRERTYKYSWQHAGKFAVLGLLWSYFYWLILTPGNTWWRLDKFLLAAYKNPTAVHLWYLYMLVAFYLMLPFLSKMVMQFKQTDYLWFMLGWLVLGSLPLTIQNCGGPTLTGWAHLELFTGFIGFFVCGQYIRRFGIPRWIGAIMLIVGLISATVITVHLSMRQGETWFALDNVMTLPSVLAAVGTFVMLYGSFKNVHSPVIEHLSKLTFGIYLVHLSLVKPLEHVPAVAQAIQSNTGVHLLAIQLGMDVFIFIGALIISQVMYLIPGVKKLIS